MKVCPQCNETFPDNGMFCLHDGSMLHADSNKTKTLDSERVSMREDSVSDEFADCFACGFSNRAKSRFCKKCGASITAAGKLKGDGVSGKAESQPHSSLLALETASVVDSPAGFVVNTTDPTPDRTAMLIVVLVAIIVIGGVIIYSRQSSEAARSNIASNANRSANVNRTVANATNTLPSGYTTTNSTSSPDWRIGRTGVLSTDSNLREYPNPNSFKLGTHYRQARVRVLEIAEVQNDEGGMSTWFRVAFISYGKSVDPQNSDYDKDPGTPDEGWVNSYPKVWDAQTNGYTRKELVVFE